MIPAQLTFPESIDQVVGTMTGAQSRKIHTEPEWAWSLTDQAHKLGIPVFMKEDLVPYHRDENMILVENAGRI